MVKHCTLQTGWKWRKTGNQEVSASGGAQGCEAATTSRHRGEYTPMGILKQICPVSRPAYGEEEQLSFCKSAQAKIR